MGGNLEASFAGDDDVMKLLQAHERKKKKKNGSPNSDSDSDDSGDEVTVVKKASELPSMPFGADSRGEFKPIIRLFSRKSIVFII